MKKLFVLLTVFLLIGCSAQKPKDTTNSNEGNEKVDAIVYHNAASEENINEMKELLKDKIHESSLSIFLNDVMEYNKSLSNLSGSYKELTAENVNYDELAISESLLAINPDYIGNNCRITTFTLIKDFVSVDAKEEVPYNLLFDNLSLSESHKFTDEELKRFYGYYEQVETTKTKDISVHLEAMKKHLADHHIKYQLPKHVSVISVVFHDDLEEVDHLFIGHTGLLVEKDESYYFIEKLSFDLPYQVIKFSSKLELNDYLMEKYDVSWGQETASPFIMENDELLKEYRPNQKK